MECPGFTLWYTSPSCKKVNLIWKKCGHAITRERGKRNKWLEEFPPPPSRVSRSPLNKNLESKLVVMHAKKRFHEWVNIWDARKIDLQLSASTGRYEISFAIISDMTSLKKASFQTHWIFNLDLTVARAVKWQKLPRK